MKRYQIFISSTYTDLKLEREAVLKNVLKLQHIPIGMEYFVSANEEQFNYIKRLLDETDYYIIIIGNRYGSLAADGISYTEKEFDYAVNLGIPVIACIHSNPDSLPVNKSDTKKNVKQKLEKFRNKVMNHRMVSYFNWDSPAALSAEIVVALVNTIERYPRPGWERVASHENSNSLNPINDSYRYSKLYELISNWHKYDSAQVGETASEIAFYRLLNLFIDDSYRYEIAKPLLDKCYIEELERKKEECEKLLNALVGAETPDGKHSEDFPVIKQKYFDNGIEFSEMLKETINCQIKLLLEKSSSK